jgi:hypothetical protein
MALEWCTSNVHETEADMAKKIQYHFVLSKEDVDSGLKAHMDELAEQKKLTAKIKTALTLLAQLENGNTELLDTMFPQIREMSPQKKSPPDGDLQQMIAETVQASVKEAMQNFPPLPAGRVVAEPAYKEVGGSISGAVGLASKKIAMPVILDDDEDTIVLTKVVGGTSTDNFLAAFAKVAF